MDRLPPGPRSKTLTTLAWIRDPLGFLHHCLRRYGDPFTLRYWTFGTVVVTTTPEGIQEIATAPPETFASNLAVAGGPLFGDYSIFLMDGARHRRERALLMPPWHGARLKAYGQVVREIALRHARAWQPGLAFRMYETTQAISREVIIRAIFGAQHPERVQVFTDALRTYVLAFSPWLAYFTASRRVFGGLGPWTRFTRARARLERLTSEEVAARRKEPGAREDVLSLLLAACDEGGHAMTEQEVNDEVRSLLFAGYETVAIALAWAFYWIHRQPAVSHRLQAELRPLGPAPQPDALAQLPYLSAICDEALRLNPPVPGFTRKLKHPFMLRGYEVPAGVNVAASILGAHRAPMRYPDPTHFRPERFLERTYTPFEYLPFGGGVRRCVGAAFAVYETKIALGSILAQHRLVLAEDEPVKLATRNFTHAPRGGLMMRYTGLVEVDTARQVGP
jgi:cytochrome P450